MRSQISRFSYFIAALMLLSALLLLLSAGQARAEENYGERAYGFLEVIDSSYPYRVTNASSCPDDSLKKAAGAWIYQTLTGFGYSVSVQEWNHEGDDIISYVAEKAGRSSQKLVIGAHYDSVNTKGVDDNGTGVALLLELAERFASEDTGLSLVFGFWDGEETSGYAGSCYYVNNTDLSSVIGYINLDTLGAGDSMFAYGGCYENDTLTRDWMYNMAVSLAAEEGIELHSIPAEVNAVWEGTRTPTRTRSSDQYYFNVFGIPYVYFESNAWLTPEGTLGNTSVPHLYNSSLPAFASTGGQILHTEEFEDLATLNSLVPGRVESRLRSFSILVTRMIREMSASSPGLYLSPSVSPAESSAETQEEREASVETEAEYTETEAPEEAAPSEASSESLTEEESMSEGPADTSQETAAPDPGTETADSETAPGNTSEKASEKTAGSASMAVTETAAGKSASEEDTVLTEGTESLSPDAGSGRIRRTVYVIAAALTIGLLSGSILLLLRRRR